MGVKFYAKVKLQIVGLYSSFSVFMFPLLTLWSKEVEYSAVSLRNRLAFAYFESVSRER